MTWNPDSIHQMFLDIIAFLGLVAGLVGYFRGSLALQMSQATEKALSATNDRLTAVALQTPPSTRIEGDNRKA